MTADSLQADNSVKISTCIGFARATSAVGIDGVKILAVFALLEAYLACHGQGTTESLKIMS